MSRMADTIGAGLARRLEELTLDIYRRAAEYAASRGILLADTKFEFGWCGENLVWIDEALTPDSSRFWPAASYRPGTSPPSFDKQYLRDWLESTGWNKTPPAPELPPGVVAGTRRRYVEAFELLTGQAFGE
jgi:phosphoribosylaminoimidazole-succinocarboxamide synthase